jgi:class 3 adenylate cyclase/tetratricopeptide (TPR) repeat protein
MNSVQVLVTASCDYHLSSASPRCDNCRVPTGIGDRAPRDDPGFRATLLGPFSVTRGDVTAGPWERPSARRLLQLVLVSPGRRIGREAASEALFPQLRPDAATRSLNKAISLARRALESLGEGASATLFTDRGLLRADTPALVLDLEVQESGLRSGLSMNAGPNRDQVLRFALENECVLLEDEPYAAWALVRREALEALRQEARLTLARDRLRGYGRSEPAELIRAWESCFSHDPTCEEAANALIRAYRAQRRPALAINTYRRCREALEGLGLRASLALETVRPPPPAPGLSRPSVAEANQPGQELRLVSVLFAELSAPGGRSEKLDPEEMRDFVGRSIADLITQVEALGGTVTSISGAGLSAIFGAPQSHEDDPERALLAALRSVSITCTDNGLATVRIGLETGPAVVGMIGAGSTAQYGAVGEVVGIAAALQSVARPGSVLVGPTTRTAAEGLFQWGPSEEVVVSSAAKPLRAVYVDRRTARPSGEVGRRRLAGSAPLAGRVDELSELEAALRGTTAGKGEVVVLAAEPGLGKTRLVQECRKLFMAWVGAGTARLPLWLEGRATSYLSTTPYSLYQQTLLAWLGVTLEEGEEVVRAALERAVKATYGAKVNTPELGLLSRVIGLGPGPAASNLAQFDPEALRKATFAAVSSLVARLVSHGPTVLALEDLHWADPTSLLLTQELASLTQGRPLLFLLTRRPEPDHGVSRLETFLAATARVSLRVVRLMPLTSDAERELTRSLVGTTAGQAVLDIVQRGVGGNPLFLEERLSSMMETGALVINHGRWELGKTDDREVPHALERLVRSRIDRLGRDARQVIRAASVLGSEVNLSLLEALCDPDQPGRALGELCEADLLQPVSNTSEPTFRFRHALVQDAIYWGLLRSERRHLHGQTAWAMEVLSKGRLQEVAAVLGRHFSTSGELERALHYFEAAGDYAMGVFANEEAEASFRSGLATIEELAVGTEELTTAAVRLWAKMAELFWRKADVDLGCDALREAIRIAGPQNALRQAGLYTRLGRLAMRHRRFAEAQAAYEAAEALLQTEADNQDEEWAEAWLEVMVDGRAALHILLHEPALTRRALELAWPVIQKWGGPVRSSQYFHFAGWERAGAMRYRVDEEVVANFRQGLVKAREGGDENYVGWGHERLGLYLMLHGDLDEAQEELARALVIADRMGHVTMRAKTLLALAATALRGHNVEAVRTLTPTAMAAWERAGQLELLGSASVKAVQAWLAWQDNRPLDVVRLADEVLQLSGSDLGEDIHTNWVFLWPLVAVHLHAERVAEAVAASRLMLDPSQQQLPDELESILQAASAAWDRGREDIAAASLAEALKLARELRYT